MTDGVGDGSQLLVQIGGDEWTLTPGTRTVVGRSSGCDISVDNTHVSREHLALEFDGEQWTGTDLSTANGTFVEGAPASEFRVSGLTIVVIGGASGEVVSLDLVDGTGPRSADVHADDDVTVVGLEAPAASVAPLAPAGPPRLADLPPLDAPAAPETSGDPPPSGIEAPEADIAADDIAPNAQPAESEPPRREEPVPDTATLAEDPPSAPPPPAGPPAGWYPDPDDDTQERYWEGSAWGDQRRPLGADPTPTTHSPVDLPPPDDNTPPTGAPIDLPPPDDSAELAGDPAALPADDQDDLADLDAPPDAADLVTDIPPPAGYAAAESPVPGEPAFVPADWYPDPHDPTRWRYWDGDVWTDHYSPPAQ